MPRRKYKGWVKRPPDYWKPTGFKHYKTVKELAVSIGIDPSWLYKLERKGRIPEPTRVKRGQLFVRLYSPENEQEIKQILGKA